MSHYKTSHVTFLTLPRELRDQIYELSLISPSPIVVWSEELIEPPDEARKLCTEPSRWGSRRNVEPENTDLSLQHIAWNALRCNKMVRHEVAPILYGRNTFRFLDDHNWNPIVDWLNAIGPENRNFLANLEIETFRPDRVWQQADGERVRCDYTNEAVVYPRNPYLELPPDAKEGIVDNINPAIEQIFILLGNRETWHTTTLSLLVPTEMFPGVELTGGGSDGDAMIFTMDLPNLIQLYCQLYAESPTGRAPLEIYWKGEAFRPVYLVFEGKVEPTGWDVITAPEVYLTMNCGGEDKVIPYLKYTIRRRRLLGPLLASYPTRHSWKLTSGKRANE